ncbi:RICIN domain-containing protein (plasmid) [Bacillus toyonensis]
MKFLSKKVMTGLLAGATSLSIWAPSSEAATPEKNSYYSIHLAANANLTWNVYKGWQSDNAGIILWDGDFTDNEQFVFFQLDEGKYAIVNKNSGKPVGLGGGINFSDGARDMAWGDAHTLGQNNWTGASTDQWYLRDQGNNNYEIVNEGTGKVASWSGFRYTLGYTDYVDLDESNPSDNNRLFHIPAAPRSTFSLPTLPAKGDRPNAPDYDSAGRIDQQLPQTSNSVVVGTSLVPCIMVNDSQASDYTKIHNSPYYTLIEEEYWDKTFSAVVPAGVTHKYSFKTGMTSTDQQKMTDTLSMKVGADFGLKFGDASASFKTEITKTLQTEISSTDTQISEELREDSVTAALGKTTGFTGYQLARKYTLKRADGSVVSDPWVVKNNKVTITREKSL